MVHKKIFTIVLLALFVILTGYAQVSEPAPTPDLPCSLMGDVNSDGIVDMADAYLVARWSRGDPIPEPLFNENCADVNCDGTINIVDALLIAQYSVGLINEFC